MCGAGKPTAELTGLRITNTGESPDFINSAPVLDDSPASRPNRQRCPERFAFKKTCPFEFTRHGRPKAGTETRLAFLPSEVSQCDFKKGSTGFLASDWDARWLGR
jgi:hypothetical protein